LLPKESLKDLLSQKELSHTDKLLVCLAVGPDTAKQVKEIVALAVAHGLRSAKNWNASTLLKASGGKAVRTANGWELTSDGNNYVHSIAGPLAGSPIPKVASSLRAHLTKIADAETFTFVEEAINCFEMRQYRAAVVLSWVGAASVLHKHVVKASLATFNSEATKRDTKWKPAKTSDDLGLMKEDTFLDILQTISVLGKTVKQQLKECLTLRNGCGHPNTLSIADNIVAAHVEKLILNVFTKF
jgi:hypothetical protein